jgi:lipoprotein-releasing system permease protein
MLSFRIAVRFLKSGRLQTVLITIGIAVAISVQLFVGLLINSLQEGLVESTTGRTPHITVTSALENVTIRRWETIVQEVRQFPSVDAVSASVSSNAFVMKGDSTEPVLVRGFDIDTADPIYKITESIYEGSVYESRSEVLVGKELAEKLDYSTGDSITVSTPSGTESTYTITGLYDFGVASINRSWIITRVETAQKIFGFGGRVTSIDITVKDLFQADVVAGQIERTLSNVNVKVENWKDQNQELLSALESQSLSSYMIQIFILVSVVIAIASILAITVFQKSRQIGILKAMGIKDRAASFIFLYEGLLLGFTGSLLGIALGLGLLYAFTIFATTGTGDSVITFRFDILFVARSWVIALAASILAGIIPARKSLKLNPIDVIREG